jgi:hypothetical protein
MSMGSVAGSGIAKMVSNRTTDAMVLDSGWKMSGYALGTWWKMSGLALGTAAVASLWRAKGFR